jgi:hypothetical protein
MRASKRITICVLGAVLVLLLTANASLGYLLPEGLVMEDVFQPGYGHPVGKVQMVQGEAVILHEGEMLGYWAEKDLPLFKGDAIVTKDNGRIRFKLNDKSEIILSSGTKLTITQSVYDLKNKTRSSFINMAIGKAKFWAKKFADFKHSQFKVKSMTAIIGVRGSEWIEVVTEDSTRVITGPDTMLEVIPLVAPGEAPTVLENFQETTIEEGRLPSEVETITPEEYDQLQEPFEMSEEGVAVSAQPEAQKQAEEKAAEQAGVSAVTGEVLVPDQELVYPAALKEQEIAAETLTPEIIEQQQVSEQIAEFAEQQNEILQQQSEDTGIQEMPSFPGTPGS